jgi:hypothetical protein
LLTAVFFSWRLIMCHLLPRPNVGCYLPIARNIQASKP